MQDLVSRNTSNTQAGFLVGRAPTDETLQDLPNYRVSSVVPQPPQQSRLADLSSVLYTVTVPPLVSLVPGRKPEMLQIHQRGLLNNCGTLYCYIVS